MRSSDTAPKIPVRIAEVTAYSSASASCSRIAAIKRSLISCARSMGYYLSTVEADERYHPPTRRSLGDQGLPRGAALISWWDRGRVRPDRLGPPPAARA